MKTTVGTINDGIKGIYIGRPRRGLQWGWGNPFPISSGLVGYTREQSIAAFKVFIESSTDPRTVWMRNHIDDLKGKHLKCYCFPQACHGDILAKYADTGMP